MEFQTQVVEYFKTRHIYNKNSFLENPDDLKTYNQLSLEIKNDIYTGFVYRNFLKEFHKFFQFHRSVCNEHYSIRNKEIFDLILEDNRRIKDGSLLKTDVSIRGLDFPYFTFDDKDYANFITDMFQQLEICVIPPETLVIGESEECNELLFVQNGTYKMGFGLNNKANYRKLYKQGTVINGFNILYECRSQFLVKSQSLLHCYTLNKINFKRLLWQNPQYE